MYREALVCPAHIWNSGRTSLLRILGSVKFKQWRKALS
jgi:hypothetical protein